MPIATWLKRTQLKRVERKLRSLRARQRQLREREQQLRKDKDRLAPDEYQRRHQHLHDEKETLTKQVNHFIVEEERLKAELRAVEGSAASS